MFQCGQIISSDFVNLATGPLLSLDPTCGTCLLQKFDNWVMWRLHDPTVGPTGRAKRSVRPVGPTVGSCKRSADRLVQPVGRIKHVKFIQTVEPTVVSLKRLFNCRADSWTNYANAVPQSGNIINELHFDRLRRFIDRRGQSNILIAHHHRQVFIQLSAIGR